MYPNVIVRRASGCSLLSFLLWGYTDQARAAALDFFVETLLLTGRHHFLHGHHHCWRSICWSLGPLHGDAPP